MINKLLNSISSAAGISSYRIGLLQTKAYRILNQETAKVLKKYDITPFDWALLGLLYDSKNGCRLSDLAEELGVEASFITERTQYLTDNRMVTITPFDEDKRVKYMTLTTKTRKLMPDIEQYVLATMRPLLAGASLKDVLGYKRLLERIVSNKPDKDL